jgi:hypothetical protein
MNTWDVMLISWEYAKKMAGWEIALNYMVL